MPYAKPREDYSGMDLADQLSHELLINPDFQLPEGYELDPNVPGRVRKEPSWWDKHRDQVGFTALGGIATLGLMPGVGAFAGGGGAAGGAGVASSLPGTSAAGLAADASVIPSGAASGGGFMGALKNAWGGMDKTKLALGALSMLGGDGEANPYKGSRTNPEASLDHAMAELEAFGPVLKKKVQDGTTLHGYVPEGPSPVTIPGIPFQIGGGFGTDPALKDPSLLHYPGMSFNDMNLDLPSGPSRPGSPSTTPTRRRPGGA